MARLTIGQKAARTLLFIIGLRHRRARRALEVHGFTEEDMEKGWQLLRALTNTRLDALPPALDPGLLRQLDEWENRWFPIANAVLRTNYPDAHALIFRNLTQTDGAEVVVSVSTLLDRLDKLVLPATQGGLGRDGKSARSLLTKRGLDEQVVKSARDLIAQLGTVQPEPDEIEEADTREDAEQNLWNWYLEWGGIARAVITDRRVLRMLGFLAPTRAADGNTVEEEIVDEEVEDEDEVDVPPTDPNTPA